MPRDHQTWSDLIVFCTVHEHIISNWNVSCNTSLFQTVIFIFVNWLLGCENWVLSLTKGPCWFEGEKTTTTKLAQIWIKIDSVTLTVLAYSLLTVSTVMRRTKPLDANQGLWTCYTENQMQSLKSRGFHFAWNSNVFIFLHVCASCCLPYLMPYS